MWAHCETFKESPSSHGKCVSICSTLVNVLRHVGLRRKNLLGMCCEPFRTLRVQTQNPRVDISNKNFGLPFFSIPIRPIILHLLAASSNANIALSLFNLSAVSTLQRVMELSTAVTEEVIVVDYVKLYYRYNCLKS